MKISIWNPAEGSLPLAIEAGYLLNGDLRRCTQIWTSACEGESPAGSIPLHSDQVGPALAQLGEVPSTSERPLDGRLCNSILTLSCGSLQTLEGSLRRHCSHCLTQGVPARQEAKPTGVVLGSWWWTSKHARPDTTLAGNYNTRQQTYRKSYPMNTHRPGGTQYGVTLSPTT